MKTRLAKLSDAPQLAEVHWTSSSNQPGGFMFKLGKPFLIEYFRIVLGEKNSVVICTEDVDGRIIGFVSGSLLAEERMVALKRGRIRLLLAAIPSLIRDFSLVKELYSRQQSGSADTDEGGYIVQSGAREDFWAWLPSTGGAIELHLKWLSVMRLLGVEAIRGEVDLVNDFVVKIHRFLGARVVREFTTPDGKKRMVMEYRLKQ